MASPYSIPGRRCGCRPSVQRAAAMLIHEFLCDQCRNPFTCLLPLSEQESGDAKYPECLDSSVNRQLSSFQTKTSQTS
jgi:hypothetical protein